MSRALSLGTGRRPAKIGITPLIDVVFILMVFFMLATTFTHERQIDLDARQAAGGAGGDVRLLVVTPTGYELDGAPVNESALRERLAQAQDATVAVRPTGDVRLQRLIDAVDLARGEGVLNVILAR